MVIICHYSTANGIYSTRDYFNVMITVLSSYSIISLPHKTRHIIDIFYINVGKYLRIYKKLIKYIAIIHRKINIKTSKKLLIIKLLKSKKL